jgi:anti-anti-sigma factor
MSPSEPPSPAPSQERLILHVDVSPAGAVITAHGDLDKYSMLRLEVLVEDLVSRPGNERLHLVVDLGGISFMSVAGITALLVARHAVQSVSGRLVLREPSIVVRTILTLTGLLTFFDIEHTGGGDGRPTTGPGSIGNRSHQLPPRSPSGRRSPTERRHRPTRNDPGE